MTKIIDFCHSDLWEWDGKAIEVQVQVLKSIKFAKEHKKDFEIEFREIKQGKSYKQLKGLYRLFRIIAADFSKEAGKRISEANIKNIIKDEYGYYEDIEIITGNSIREYKSFKDATKNEMMEIIKLTETLGQQWGIDNCELTSLEMRAMIEYYSK